MSIANNEAQSSGDILPFRQGALDATEIRRECSQFRVLIIGKANAGKTTILRKVCNAEPDAKPIIYDPKGKKVGHGVSVLAVLARTDTEVIATVVLAVQSSSTEGCRCPPPFCRGKLNQNLV